MRIRRRQRMDALDNEVRKATHSWGRWLYLGVVCTFGLWIIDLFFGDMLYFHAEGLVVRDRMVLATQYDASVEAIDVVEGGRVNAGNQVLALRSQSVEENLAELSADHAELLSEISQLRMRQRVNDSISHAVEERAQVAHAARQEAEVVKNHGLFTTSARARLIDKELKALKESSQITAEQQAITEELPKLEAALGSLEHALDRLTQTYGNGKMLALKDGVVGYLHVALGSVVRTGEPLLELFEGTPYVLAYVPEGAVYELQPGDPIDVHVGFHRYTGQITHLYPVTTRLPKEFQVEFKRQQRARIARIDFVDTEQFPTLFARTKLSASSWPPAWMKRWFQTSSSEQAETVAAVPAQGGWAVAVAEDVDKHQRNPFEDPLAITFEDKSKAWVGVSF